MQTQVRLQPGTFPFPKERPERWLPWAIAFTTVKSAELPARVAMARTLRAHPWVLT